MSDTKNSDHFSPQADTALADRAINYEVFLKEHEQQAHNIMRYELPHETLWVKRAAQGNPALNYQLLRWMARLFSAPVLQPVPNPGGAQSLATEVRRLRSFETLGLRVPQVLAVSQTAFVMRHLGRPGEDSPSLTNAIESAIPEGAQAVLALWQRGLDALAQVHAKGEVLSQAVARNMVCCADGVIGFIDFEDDPAAHLPRAVCLARDALNYAQSTALFVLQSGGMAQAQTQWAAFVKAMPADAQEVLAATVRKLAWVRFLPLSRRLGRDALRVRAAYDLLAAAPQH